MRFLFSLDDGAMSIVSYEVELFFCPYLCKLKKMR